MQRKQTIIMECDITYHLENGELWSGYVFSLFLFSGMFDILWYMFDGAMDCNRFLYLSFTCFHVTLQYPSSLIHCAAKPDSNSRLLQITTVYDTGMWNDTRWPTSLAGMRIASNQGLSVEMWLPIYTMDRVFQYADYG
jgi:hypothetical protein